MQPLAPRDVFFGTIPGYGCGGEIAPCGRLAARSRRGDGPKISPVAPSLRNSPSSSLSSIVTVAADGVPVTVDLTLEAVVHVDVGQGVCPQRRVLRVVVGHPHLDHVGLGHRLDRHRAAAAAFDQDLRQRLFTGRHS